MRIARHAMLLGMFGAATIGCGSSAGDTTNGGTGGSNGTTGATGGGGSSSRATATGSGGGATTGTGVMGVTVTVSPKSVAVATNASQPYSCTVTGAANVDCTWNVTEAAGGTIPAASAPTAVYKAPAAAGTYHIVATSVADPAVSDTATVTVVAQMIAGCDGLTAGTWQNITPPSLNFGSWCAPYNGTCPSPGSVMNGEMGTYGTNAFVLDPNNPGTVYLGTSSLGIWKSTDCGSTWAHINTGMNGSALDLGRNWTMVMDPTNSQVLYTVSGYNVGGIYKSTNGGVDWTQILTQNILDATGATPCASSPDSQVCGGFGAFMEKITMDPTNNEHLLAGFHTDCAGTTPLPGATVDAAGGWGCLAESMDAGATWTLTTNAVPWSGLDGPGQTMIDAKTWFYGTNGGSGLWRTTTGGVAVNGKPAWTQVWPGSVNGSVYKASNGLYFAGGGNTIWSVDGITWTALPNSPGAGSLNGSTPMVDDGTTFYLGADLYYDAPLSNPPGAFAAMSSSTPLTSVPKMPAEEAPVAYLDFEATHHILYTSNLDGGFWRFVTK